MNIYDKKFLSDNLKDPAMVDPFLKVAVRKARLTAIILGSVSGIALIACVYAFVQRSIADQVRSELEANKIEITRLTKELQECSTK